MQRIRRWARAASAGVLVAWLGLAGPALAARVASVSPAGEVATVRQVVVRFSEAVVPAGDPRLPAPFTLLCNGAKPPGDGRWTSDRSWVYDLREVLAAGSRCTLRANPAFQPLGGALQGATNFGFSTGAPVVVSVQPYPGSRIDEDQHFLLRLNGEADAASVQRAVWCEVEGLGERLPVVLVQGAAREALLRQRWRDADPRHVLLLACQRPFPAEAGVRLVWGAGVAAAGQTALVSRREQRFEWKVRPRFLAEFRCERENAQSPCLPLRPLVLRFNAPVPRAAALAVRLQPAQGEALVATAEGSNDWIQELRFAAPLPENTRFTLTLPADLRDDAGRALANAAAFPLPVATGGLPPLAKFPGGGFGIVEAGPEAMLPLTLRHVQADLAGASTGGRVAIKRLHAATTDEALLRWITRLQQDHAAQFKTRDTSLLADETEVRRAELPQLPGGEARATEVLGVPLPQTGFHVVEVESRLLGHALLARQAPMYVRTGALVTNLGVHFKRGRSSSLVWVTRLDRGRPVAGARVTVNDCRGQPLWSGRTDAQGLARIDRGFDEEFGDRCLSSDGHFVTARLGDDLSFVFGRWNRGFEPWRFNIPVAGGTPPDWRAHTVFDRTLLRVGETVSMKHVVREETERGLAWPAAETLPGEVVLTHVGSGKEIVLPLAWPPGPNGASPSRAAESRWVIPKTAALGLYDVALKRGDERLPSGNLRVEAFRVPLVDARLAAPARVPVAPDEVVFQAQLNALSGGPVAAAPLQLSALLRPAVPIFAGHEDFSFAPARGGDGGNAAEGSEEADERDRGDADRLVADKLPAVTSAQGAAAVVVKSLPPLTGPADLLAELSFADPNGEVQTVAQRVRLWPAAVVAGLSVPRWAGSRGQARFTAVVLDTAGRPLPGRTVEVAGRLQQTITTRKRIVGGFYAYDNRRQSRELGALCSGRTDAQGRLHCEAKMETSGEVELLARARDDAGRLSEAAATVWVSAGGEWWFGQDDDDRIDLLPEAREVEPGQTARLQVRMPFRQATALVTVEREGVIDARVLTLGGSEPVIELPVPKAADRSWAPNVTVSVLVLRGRLRDAPWWSAFTWGWRDPAEWWRAFRYEGRDWRAPTALADLARPAFRIGVAQLTVGLAEHRLDVQVTPEKAQYGVRETVKTTVRVSHAGQPAAGAEIAFAAVDEGLLALQDNRSWDLLGAMMAPRPWGVETATAQGQVIGRRHYGRKALPPGGGGGRNPTRELFDTLLLWRGSVVLDANGQARIDVPLNDSLTSFRLVAVATAGADRFGSGRASVRVTQDLQLLPGLPPLARQGDRFDAGFTLRNTTARLMTVRATLAGRSEGGGSGDEALSFEAQTLTLAAGAAQEVKWRVAVPAGAARITWQAAADETGQGATAAAPARDRVQVVQAVQPAVPVRTWQASLQPLQGTLTLPVAAPAGALAGSGSVVATLQPRLGGALPGLRRFFETYPYTCLEQQVSRAIALRDAAAWATLRDEVAGYLDADGLAAFFPPEPGAAPRGSDRLTAHLLSAAHEAGWDWPDAAREAMLGGLAAFVEGRIERRFAAPRADLAVRKLAALDALARHGRATPRLLGSVGYTPAAWPTSALLDQWSVLRRVPGIPQGEARLAEVQRLLRSRLVAGGTTLKFSTEAGDDWWWLMDGPDANAARLVLAATTAPDWRAELPQLVNGALARQQRGAWSTTTANLWGVLALERFAATMESVPVAGRTELQLGAQAGTLDWQAAPDGGAVTLPLEAAASAPASFSARHEGAGRPWLTLQTLAAVPLQAPLAAGYRITRSVSSVQRQRPEAWSRGDIQRVRLEIEAVGDMAWVVLSDPVPAGATLLGGGLGRDSALATRGEQRQGMAWPTFEERAPEAWRAYFEWLPRGRHVVEYTLRLNASGRFGLPPTRVEAMYAPETFGEQPNAVLEVMP
ncbi:MAG: MG2 domain-containing protein [Rubrivivax sp.]|nr:MG2 domain-containing protein [Rubrivivax sp.]